MAMAHRYSFALLLLCASLASPAPARADTATLIRVHLGAGRTLPASARATLRSVAYPLLAWSTEIATEDAPVIFRHVPPGRYVLVVEAAGFHQAYTEIAVDPATIHDLVADLGPNDDPNGRSVLRRLRADTFGYSRVFDQAMLETVPADDPLVAVEETVAAPLIADRMSNGGLWAGEGTLAGANGSSWRNTSIRRGELDVTDPVQLGVPFLTMNHSPPEWLMVATALLPPSVAGPGPLLTVIPQAPAREWHGRALIGAMHESLQGRNDAPGAPSVARFRSHGDASLQTGGHLGSRASLFLSTHVVSSDRLERTDTQPLATSVAALHADTFISTGPDSRLQLGANIDRLSAPYSGRARFRDRTVSQRSGIATLQAEWESWTTAGTAWSVSSAFQRALISATPALSSSDRSAGGTVERLRDGPVGALFAASPGTIGRWTTRVEIEPAAGSAQAHAWTIGATFARNRAAMRWLPSPPVAELVAALPARVWEYTSGASQTHWRSSELAVYAADHLTLPGRVRLDTGLRVDGVRGSARAAADGIAWISTTPRVGLRWSVDARQRLILFGGYALYAHRLPLDYFAYGDPAAGSGIGYRWNDANADRIFQENERGEVIEAVGPCCTPAGVTQIDPSLERPRTRELLAGLDVRLGRWSIRIAEFDRFEWQQIGVANVGVTGDDYEARDILDPGEPFIHPPQYRVLRLFNRKPASFGRDRYVLTNVAADTMEFRGAEITVDGAVGAFLRTRFDGAIYDAAAVAPTIGFGPLENDPGAIAGMLGDPNAQTYSRGHPFFDRAYVIKWWTSYTAPGGFLASAVARYQDGQPFARTVVVPDLNQGPTAVQAYRRGAERFTFTLTLDAHLEKSFRVGRSTVAGVFELFNALNTANEVEEHVVADALYRTPTAVQPPRAARVGVRVSF